MKRNIATVAKATAILLTGINFGMETYAGMSQMVNAAWWRLKEDESFGAN